MLNHASEWRLALAKEITPLYAANPQVKAVTVAGSVARGWADEWSDIELEVFWSEPPTDADRHSPIDQLHGELLEYLPFEPEEWEESYALDGVKIEVNHYLVATIEQFIPDVLERFDTTIYKQLRFAGIQHSISLYGSELIASWRTQIQPYPKELAQRIIQENMSLDGWNGVEMLLHREDLLIAYCIIVKVQRQLLFILLALNHTYVANPLGKWFAPLIAEMELKPPQLADRLRFALQAHSIEGAQVMEGVIRDVFSLVHAALPGLDTSEAEHAVFARRTRVTH